MKNYTYNSDPLYYENNRFQANCGSYAFNVKEWYDAEDNFDDLVDGICDWASELAIEGYTNEEISDIYAAGIVPQILNDFGDDVREVEDEFASIEDNEELIAMRTFCVYYEDEDYADFDFHFKVFRNGQWMEKCGSEEVKSCSLYYWPFAWHGYISQTYYFAHKIS